MVNVKNNLLKNSSMLLVLNYPIAEMDTHSTATYIERISYRQHCGNV